MEPGASDLMDCYATMFCRWAVAENGYLENILAKGLRPEIGLQFGGLDKPCSWHQNLAQVIKDKGLHCSVHLPFVDIIPGAADPTLRAHSREELLKAVELANIYTPDHLICHPNLQGLDSARAKEYSQKVWVEVLDLSPARLYMENSYELNPVPIMALLAELPDRAGMCLDIGHWYYGADGHVLNNLGQWLDIIGSRLRHLHLHDNDGSADQHLGIGRGSIDFKYFFNKLRAKKLKPTFTLEAHNPDDLQCSLNWFTRSESRF